VNEGAKLIYTLGKDAKPLSRISELPKSVSSLSVVVRADAKPDAKSDAKSDAKPDAKPVAYSIECYGNWESLRDPKKLEDGLKDVKPSEKLSIFIRNDLIDYVLVTEVFKTSGNFTAFTIDLQSPQLTIDTSKLPPFPSNDAYKQLATEIKIKSSESEFKASVDSFVPFVRLRKLKPMWLLDDKLQEKAVFLGNESRGLPYLGRDRIVKPPDTISIPMLEPGLII